MKYLLMILAVVMIFAGQALAADGNVSHDALAKMGLSGLNVMSDAQGTAIRGLGWSKVNVFGAAQVALLGGPVSTAGYDATGKCFATGSGKAVTSVTQYELVTTPPVDSLQSTSCLVPVCKVIVCAKVSSCAFAK